MNHEHGDHDHHPRRSPHPTLERRPGQTLFIDAFSGISGDMFISGMLDLGVPLEVVEEAVSTLPLEGYRLERGQRIYSGIAAASFHVIVSDDQPHRNWHDIDNMLKSAALPDGVSGRARKVFQRLAEAEGQVHGIAPTDVHFHEVGAVDAIVDIVGASAVLEWMNPSKTICTPLPIGHGTVHVSHGLLPLPAPATVACLRGVPTYGVDVQGELVTPTGAAIVSCFSDQYARWPTITPEASGFGSGTKEWGNLPNLVRMVVGTDANQNPCGAHTVLEANVDDMTGELAGHAIQTLMNAGALDVWVTSSTTKKGRPGLVLSVLAERASAASLQQVVLRETTSLGVRAYEVTRLERPRQIRSIKTQFGVIPVKVGGGGYGADQIKPEFDACVRAAKEHGISVREILHEININWKD